MKALVIYDSAYGNTKTIAEYIGKGIASDAQVLNFREVNLGEVSLHDLLVIGAPTYGGRPTPAMIEFLDKLSTINIKGIKAAAYDTRINKTWVKIFGFAAGKIARDLDKKGCSSISPPEGFFVLAKEGPLQDGETARAEEWGKKIAKSMS